MNRRKAMKVTAGTIAAGGAGLFILSNAFKPKIEYSNEPQKLDYNQAAGSWNYSPLDPATTAELAYKYYPEGSCMYATIKSVVTQLAEKIGEPFISFPYHMFIYGHGGVGGYGTLCGTLNGTAALLGLLISDKSVQNKIIADIFKWYEKEPLPIFESQNSGNDYIPAQSISNSVLCHASITKWCKTAGFKVNSNERKERCRRMTADVAKKVAISLNEIFTNTYTTNGYNNETENTCLTCHSSEGKVNNVAVEMSCDPCHSESVGHRVFSDVHYKLMKE